MGDLGCSLEFCWTVTASDNCGGGTDLSMTVETYSDSETGSWGSFACANDPNFFFPATMQCCDEPTVTLEDVYICEGETADLAAIMSNDVISVLWTPGGEITQSISVTPATTTNYSVTVQNNCNSATASATIFVTPQPDITQMPIVDECVSGTFNIQSIVPDIVGTGLAGGTFTFYGDLSGVPSINEVTDISPPVDDKSYWVHVVQGTDPNECDDWELFNITLKPQPELTAIPPIIECGEFDLSSILISDVNGLALNGATITYHQDGGGAPGAQLPSPDVSQSGTYWIQVDLDGCIDATSVNITITPLPELNPVDPQMDCDQFDLSSVVVTDANGADLSGATNTYHQDNGGVAGNTISPIVMVSGFYWTVVELNNCSDSVRYQVTVNESPTAEITGNTQLCNGGSTTLDAGDGYTQYQWSPGGQNTQTITTSDDGTYSVTVTDAFGCTDEASIEVIVANELSPSITGNDQFCDGESTVLDVGGYAIYVWNPGAETTQTITVTTDGTYTVTVTDISGCSGTASKTVTQAVPIAPSISGDNQLCAGESTTLTTSGFVQYTWSPGGETDNFIIVDAAGDYSVVVTDQYGCTGSASINVNQSAQITTAISGDNTICFGESATLEAEAGFAQYVWSPGGQTTQTITTSVGATYNVTVTDADGCTGTASSSITQTPEILPEITGDEQVCLGESTELQATAGFDGYLWSGGETTQTINPSTVGDYFVTVTDADGCTGSATFILNGSPAPTPVIDGSDNVCAGQSTFLDAGVYAQYIWGPNGETGQSIEISQVGTYTVTVTDDIGCTGSATHTLSEIQPINPAISGILERCVGGSTSLTADAGFSLYNWTPGGQTTPSITVTTDGVYTVTALDVNGCLGSASVTVTEIPEPVPSISGTDPFCPGTESLLTTDPGYAHYQWNIGGTDQTRTITEAGTYAVTVTDANGCSGSAEVSVNTTPLPNPSIFGDTEFCEGGSASISVGSGLPGYEWSTGDAGTTITVTDAGQYCITITDANGCTGSGCVDIIAHSLPEPIIDGELIICNGSPTILNVAAGFDAYIWSDGTTINEITASTADTYCVTVTDGNGCEGSACVDVTENSIIEPAISGNLAICSGAETTLSTDAGFTDYIWNGGETINEITVSTANDYCVTVTDANGCTGTACVTVENNDNPVPTITGNAAICGGASTVLATAQAYDTYLWSDASDLSEISVTAAGNYCVTVTDSGGCTGSNCIEVVILPPITANITGDTEICEGETGTLTADAGFSEYIWESGETTADISVSAADTYCVTVTDADGCTTSACADVIVNPAPTVAIAGELTFCEDGSTALTADAGFDEYAWTGGGTDQSATFDASGNYCVTVTDGNACTATACVNLAVNPLPQPEIDGELDYCEGASTTLSLTQIYETYEWSDASLTDQITVTTAGNYCVTVSDINGCTASVCADVVENPLPQPNISGNLQPCEGETSTLSADPGFATYLWSNAAATPDINVSADDTYCVTVTDANGCEGSFCVDVIFAPLPEPDITGETAYCEGENTILEATAGFDVYAWSSGEPTESITVMAAGNYSVTVTDGNGCTGTANVSVVENPNPQPSITGSLSFCVGGNTTLQAGEVYSQYEWSTGNSTPDITVGIADTYCLTVTDVNGCVGSTCVDITEQSELTPVIGGGGNLCEGETATLDAGAGFAAYNWSNGATDQLVPVTDPNTYCVTVTDAGGCTGSACTDVLIVPLPVTVITGDLTLCGGSNGTLSAGSGYAGYEWTTGDQTDQIIIDETDTYCVTITDANGCTSSTCANVTISPDLEPVIQGELEFCNGSNTTISVDGTYDTYNWSTGGNNSELTVTTAGEYCVTVSDASGCSGSTCVELTETEAIDVAISGDLNFCFEGDATLEADAGYTTYEWSNGTSSATLNVVNPNTYCVTVTDADGCTGSACVDVEELPEVSPDITGSLSYCSGSSTELNAGGGYASYAWTGGGTDQSLEVTSPGQYCVTVSDADGCTGVDCVDVEESAELSPDIAGDLDICFGTETVLEASAGFDGYEWSTTETTANITVSVAGQYCVTVSDASGCSGTACVEVVINPDLVPDITGSLSYCSGSSTELNAGGGYASYAWTGGGTDQSLEVTSPGQYCVTVSDADGCTGVDCVDVEESAELSPDIAGDLDICFGTETVLEASAGFDGYEWSTTETTANITVSVAGQYCVTVSDASGCSGTACVEVVINPDLVPDITGSLSYCSGSSTELNAGGGYASYAWTGGGTDQSLEVTSPGQYCVTVSDADGCTGVDCVDVEESAELSPDIAGDLDICFGTETVLEASAGFDGYEWSTTETTANITVSARDNTA